MRGELRPTEVRMEQIQNGGPVGCARMSPGPARPYRAPGPPEVQVDALARLVEMSLHILFPETQECVHANVEATLRLLQDKKQGRKHGGLSLARWGDEDPGSKTSGFQRKVLFSNKVWLLASHLPT